VIWKSVRGRLGFGLCLVLGLNYAVVMLCRCMFSMDPSPTVSGMVLMKRLILNFRCLDRWRHPGWDRAIPSPHPYFSKQICNKVACLDSLQYSTVQYSKVSPDMLIILCRRPISSYFARRRQYFTVVPFHGSMVPHVVRI